MPTRRSRTAHELAGRESDRLHAGTVEWLTARFFVNAEVSSQGHIWSTAAYVTNYGEKIVPSGLRRQAGRHRRRREQRAGARLPLDTGDPRGHHFPRLRRPY